MAKYKVIALSVGTKHGVKNAGDVVTENDFPQGHVPKLIEGKFLELVKEKKKAEPKKDADKKK